MGLNGASFGGNFIREGPSGNFLKRATTYWGGGVRNKQNLGEGDSLDLPLMFVSCCCRKFKGQYIGGPESTTACVSSRPWQIMLNKKDLLCYAAVMLQAKYHVM